LTTNRHLQSTSGYFIASHDSTNRHSICLAPLKSHCCFLYFFNPLPHDMMKSPFHPEGKTEMSHSTVSKAITTAPVNTANQW